MLKYIYFCKVGKKFNQNIKGCIVENLFREKVVTEPNKFFVSNLEGPMQFAIYLKKKKVRQIPVQQQKTPTEIHKGACKMR